MSHRAPRERRLSAFTQKAGDASAKQRKYFASVTDVLNKAIVCQKIKKAKLSAKGGPASGGKK